MFVVMFSTCLRSHFSKLLVVKKHPFYLLLLCNSPTLEHLQHFFNFCLLVNFVSSSEYTDLRTTNVICVARVCSPQKKPVGDPCFRVISFKVRKDRGGTSPTMIAWKSIYNTPTPTTVSHGLYQQFGNEKYPEKMMMGLTLSPYYAFVREPKKSE